MDLSLLLWDRTVSWRWFEVRLAGLSKEARFWAALDQERKTIRTAEEAFAFIRSRSG